MINFHYKTYGDNTKQPLLMLHGFLGSHKDFDEIRKKLSGQFYLIIPDLPGHGQTVVSDNEEFCMPVCAGELINLLDCLKINQIDLIGYSMGGRLALFMAVNYPERFKKIILESSSPGLKTSEERQERIIADLRLSEKINNTGIADFVAAWYRLPLFKTIDKNSNSLRKLLENRSENNKTGLSLSLEKMGTGAQPSLWENLTELNNNLLLLVGEFDDKFIDIANMMIEKNNRFEKIIVPDTSHMIHFEKPDEFTKIVEQFLTK